jgi:hypothetical protein
MWIKAPGEALSRRRGVTGTIRAMANSRAALIVVSGLPGAGKTDERRERDSGADPKPDVAPSEVEPLIFGIYRVVFRSVSAA